MDIAVHPLIEQNRKALHAFIIAHLGHNLAGSPWDPVLIAYIEQMREETRVEQQGGGMCHLVSEWLEHDHQWLRLPVSYLSAAGELICAGHYVNVLPDGSIVDATADQFGEGHSVRHLKPDDPAYGQFRPEFDSDYNPTKCAELAAFAWDGRDDFDADNILYEERGPGWWLEDKSAYIAYLRHQVALGGLEYRVWLRDMAVPVTA